MGYSQKLSKFEAILLLRILRPDKLVPAMQAFVAEKLGQQFTEPPPFDLEGTYAVGGWVGG